MRHVKSLNQEINFYRRVLTFVMEQQSRLRPREASTIRLLCIILMKQGQWHPQITKINLDLSLSKSKTQNKHRESIGLGLHIRDGKVSTFKTILRKVYEAQSRKHRGAQSMTVSSYVSKREKVERESSGLCQSTPLKNVQEDIFQVDHEHGGKGGVCVRLKQGIKSVKQIKQAEQSKQIHTASPYPHFQTVSHVHHYRDAARTSINPYSGNQYLYLQNASRDSLILSRCSTSKKKFRNSITRSYKVSGMPLLPQSTQKRTLTYKKTLDFDKISLKQRKKKPFPRKVSDVLPWQWHEQPKTNSDHIYSTSLLKGVPISFIFILTLPNNNFIPMQTDRAVPPEGKVVYYRSDGTGRDTYIRDHNGGLLTKDKIHQLTQFRPPRERNFTFSQTKYGKHPYEYNRGGSNKFVHYVSDGSGRDFYVGATEGGNSTPFRWRNETDFYFKNTLRGHQPLPKIDPENPDVFRNSQTKFTGTNEKFHKTMSSIQEGQSRRLSQHKKSPVPPAVETYFQKGFDTTVQFRKKAYGINH